MAIAKVSELWGAALDWAVGKACSGHNWENAHFRAGWMSNWKPSTDWSHGGPLIEEYRVDLSPPPIDTSRAGWDARVDYSQCLLWINGSTALIAACRAIVAAKLGDEIEVPDELISAA